MTEELEKREKVNENLTLISRRDGLSLGTDSYLLSAWLKRKPKGTACELGAGTGIISLLCLGREAFHTVTCIELQEDFCDLLRRNAEENGFSSRMTVLCRDVRECSSADIGGECDVVFANPPYQRADAGFAAKGTAQDIARRECNGTVADFCASAARLLRYGGYFDVVFRADRSAELICAMSACGLTPKRMTMVHADAGKPPTLVLCEGKKGAGNGIFVTKPLFLYENGSEHPEVTAIYENGAFDEQYQKP